MILRSLTKHVRDQNWFAVGLDFFIVVVGILIAFQITNWNEGRKETALQHTYSQRLERDFGGIRQRLDEHVITITEAVEGADYILSLVRINEDRPDEEAVDDVRLAAAFNALTQERLPPPLPATYLEMVSEGKLSGIRNGNLRDKLAEYVRLQYVVEGLAGSLLDTTVVQGLILQRYFDITTIPDDTALSGIRIVLLSYDLGGMRSDRDFIPTLTTRQQGVLNTLQLRKTQISLIDEILTLLELENSP
jgi:hypothetical protein